MCNLSGCTFVKLYIEYSKHFYKKSVKFGNTFLYEKPFYKNLDFGYQKL